MEKVSKYSRKNNTLENLPLDCWGYILLFIQLREDFISILLSIKHLYDYTKYTCPNCTTSVELKVRKIPEKVHLYVSNLICGLFPEKEYHFLNTQCNRKCKGELGFFDIISFFDQIGIARMNNESPVIKLENLLKMFPNINSFSIGLLRTTKLIETEQLLNMTVRGDWIHTFKLEDTTYINTSLKTLKLALSTCDLHIRQRFPNVRNLVLFRMGEEHHEKHLNEQWREEVVCGRDFFSRNELLVDWKFSFPNLRFLELLGWEVNCSLSDLKPSLEHLILDFTKLNFQKNISNFDFLRTLVLKNTTINEIEKLGKLPKLRHIRLESKGRLNNQWLFRTCCFTKLDLNRNNYHVLRTNPEILQKFQIQGFPELVVLEIIHNKFYYIDIFDPQPTGTAVVNQLSYSERNHNWKTIPSSNSDDFQNGNNNSSTKECGELLLQDLPSLRKLRVENVPFCVVLLRTPQIEVIESTSLNSKGRTNISSLGTVKLRLVEDLENLKVLKFDNDVAMDDTIKFNIPLFKNTLRVLSFSNPFQMLYYLSNEEFNHELHRLEIKRDKNSRRRICPLDITDFPNLQELCVSGDFFLRRLWNCPNLEIMKVSYSNINRKSYYFSEKNRMRVFEQGIQINKPLPKLYDVEFRYIPSYDLLRTILSQISRNMEFLKKLVFYQCIDLESFLKQRSNFLQSNQDLHVNLSKFPLIQSLDFIDFHGPSLSVFSGNTNLKSPLTLSSYERLKISDIQGIAEICVSFTSYITNNKKKEEYLKRKKRFDNFFGFDRKTEKEESAEEYNYFEISDCYNIQSLHLQCDNSRVILIKNLPKLDFLALWCRFNIKNQFKIIMSPNIRILEIKLWFETDKTISSNYSISGDDFPNLKEIMIERTEKYSCLGTSNTLWLARINEMSDLKNLERISCRGADASMFGFVKKIQGIDLDSVRVSGLMELKVTKVDPCVLSIHRKREVHSLTLREYFQYLKDYLAEKQRNHEIPYVIE